MNPECEAVQVRLLSCLTSEKTQKKRNYPVQYREELYYEDRKYLSELSTFFCTEITLLAAVWGILMLLDVQILSGSLITAALYVVS